MTGAVRERLVALAHRVFARHARPGRHERDRERFRALHPAMSFETFLVRVYALSWVGALLGGGMGIWLTLQSLDCAVVVNGLGLTGGRPVVIRPALLGAGVGTALGGGAKLGTRTAASAALALRSRQRRRAIERTLPGAVRYLHVIAAGTTDPATLFEGVVEKRRVHGATADSFEAVLRHARLTGSVESGIRTVARTTPSKEELAPFLRTFLARSRESPASLREFLHDESRLMASEDERAHRRESRYLAAVVELFVLLLVVPVVLVLVVAGATIAVPAVTPAIAPSHLPDLTSTVALAGSGVVLLFGAVAAGLALLLRPSGHRWAAPAPADRPIEILRTAPRNPTNALIVLAPVVLGGILLLWVAGWDPRQMLVPGYVLLAVPVGLVDARRARHRAAMDRQLPTFIHAVAERVDAGLPLRTAVRRVARETDFGPLDPHVARFAVDLSVGGHDGPVRKRALERFIGRIGTPFAGRTLGLAVGALDAGADMRSALAALETETGRLVHAEQARRARFPAVIAIGWTAALLIVAVVVAVNLLVLDGTTPAGMAPVQGVVIDPTLGAPASIGPRFSLLTQSTMLASGWFAGVAGRGVYEGLLHSGGLLAVTLAIFHVAGLA